MFHAGQQRLLGQSNIAHAHAHALRVNVPRCLRWCECRHDARRLRCHGQRVTALADAAGQRNAHYRVRHVARNLQHFAPQLCRIGHRHPQAITTFRESPHVARPQRRRRTDQTDAFEQAIAIGETAVQRRDLFRHHTVDQHARVHQSGTPSARSRPRALARVSSSSLVATESATMPAPARRLTSLPARVRVRIRMFKSSSPLRSR